MSSASARAVRAVLGVVYVGLLLLVTAPVLLTSVGADDRYWLLEVPPLAHGSVVGAWWQPVTTALDFVPQNRPTALSFADRQGFDTLVMNLSATFGVPPMLFWALAKLVLLLLALLAVRALLTAVRYRDRDGQVARLGRRTVTVVTLALPLAIAVGTKSQNLGSFNGWNNYPTLTYGLFPLVVAFAAAAMRLTDAVTARFRLLAAPVLLLLLVTAVVVNFSYELLIITVPVVLAAVLLRPRPREGGWWRRWRATVLVGGGYAVAWAVVYAGVHALIARRPCTTSDCAYEGTQVELRPRTLVDNLLGSFPVGTRAAVTDQARQLGVPFPGPGGTSVLVGLALAVVLGGLLLLAGRTRPLTARRAGTRDDVRDRHRDDRAADEADQADEPVPAQPEPWPLVGRDEPRGLAVVALIALGIALGCSLVTGITARAVETVVSPLMSYRVGPVVWSAVALFLVVAVVAVVRAVPRPVGLVAVAVVLAVAAAGVAVTFPRNVLSAQANRAQTSWYDRVHTQVAVGEKSPAANKARCALLRERTTRKTLGSSEIRTIDAAYSSFAWYHGGMFCRSRLGFRACPARHWAMPERSTLPCFDRSGDAASAPAPSWAGAPWPR